MNERIPKVKRVEIHQGQDDEDNKEENQKRSSSSLTEGVENKI
jgi:hypothetical protein